jgi:carboxypeptidase Q
MKKLILLLTGAIITLLSLQVTAQVSADTDSAMIRKLYNEALQNGKTDSNLRYLTSGIGARISGSLQAQQTVDWAKRTMAQYHPDTIYLQCVMVPHWERGAKEISYFTSNGSKVKMDVAALGGSIGTNGILTAPVVEVTSWAALAALQNDQVRGKFVFFNRAMDPTEIETFKAYLAAADQRTQGAVAASKKGAVGALVRSLTLAKDDYPHTGAMSYDSNVKKIPAAALSTNSADKLSDALKKDPALRYSLRMNCIQLPDALSYNVIAELKGSTYPNEYVTVGAHLDSWDLSESASDDGTGLVQAMEVLRLFKAIALKPERTIRIILYMNEEAGAHGALKYAEQARIRKEKHVAAIESDAGGFTPRGFRIEASEATMSQFQQWSSLFAAYKAGDIQLQQRGVDLVPMRGMAKALISLDCDDSRLFYIHHSALDTYDKINPREVLMGAAAMAAMVALISKHGL